MGYHRRPFDPQMLNNLNSMNAIPGMTMVVGNNLPIGYETEQFPHSQRVKAPPPLIQYHLCHQIYKNITIHKKVKTNVHLNEKSSMASLGKRIGTEIQQELQ